MRIIGVIFLLVGLVGLVVVIGMDTSVATGLGGRVNNIGLMNQQQNLLLVFGVVSIVGAIFIAVRSRVRETEQRDLPASAAPVSRPCPFCAERIRPEAIVCRFCQRDIPKATEGEVNVLHPNLLEDRARLAVEMRLRGDSERLERAEASKPKGTCPNCNSIIAIDSKTCPKCTASFEDNSAWQVRPL